MENVWESLYKFQPGEQQCNLAPNTQCLAKIKKCYEKPWLVEKADPTSFAYKLNARQVLG